MESPHRRWRRVAIPDEGFAWYPTERTRGSKAACTTASLSAGRRGRMAHVAADRHQDGKK